MTVAELYDALALMPADSPVMYWTAANHGEREGSWMTVATVVDDDGRVLLGLRPFE